MSSLIYKYEFDINFVLIRIVLILINQRCSEYEEIKVLKLNFNIVDLHTVWIE